VLLKSCRSPGDTIPISPGSKLQIVRVHDDAGPAARPGRRGPGRISV
jgi:hypothetical protein